MDHLDTEKHEVSVRPNSDRSWFSACRLGWMSNGYILPNWLLEVMGPDIWSMVGIIWCWLEVTILSRQGMVAQDIYTREHYAVHFLLSASRNTRVIALFGKVQDRWKNYWRLRGWHFQNTQCSLDMGTGNKIALVGNAAMFYISRMAHTCDSRTGEFDICCCLCIWLIL